MTEILKCVALQKSYQSGNRRIHVLRGVDLSVSPGEFLAIVGASGAGKSTLLHLMGALDRPDSGQVLYRGTDIFSGTPTQQDRLRNAAFGFVFQFYYLLPEFTALENVLMPAMVGQGVMKWLKVRGGLKDRARELLEKFGLGERLTHRPNQLSGGEQQRVAIARALVNQPPVLLCDEPTGNLDERTSGDILQGLVELNTTSGQTMVMVTHDPDIARRAHRIVHLAGGHIEPVG